MRRCLAVATAASLVAAPTRLTAQPAPSDVVFDASTAAAQIQAKIEESGGGEMAYSFCTGSVVAPQAGKKPRLAPELSPCGSAANPSALVRGGSPPYHFVLDSGWGFPPMGMYLDANGMLHGKYKGKLPARFRVCAVDTGASQSCQLVEVQPPQAGARKARGPSGGRVLAAVLLAGGIGVGAVAAGTALGKAATAASGSCVSSRNCIVSVIAGGCECSQSTANGPCDWTGSVASEGQGCGSGVPCAQGLSCNNGRCEGPRGRCPF